MANSAATLGFSAMYRYFPKTLNLLLYVVFPGKSALFNNQGSGRILSLKNNLCFLSVSKYEAFHVLIELRSLCTQTGRLFGKDLHHSNLILNLRSEILGCLRNTGRNINDILDR